MIISANTWRKNIDWMVTIDLTTTPSSIIITDELGSYSLSTWSQTGGRLSFKVIARSSFFSVVLNTEAKVLHFDESEHGPDKSKGDFLAPSVRDSTQRSIYLPLCNTTAVELDIYNANGGSLKVQHADRTPWWTIGTVSSRTILGVTYPCIKFELNWSGSTRYLVSPATNTWADLRSIPFRVVSSPLVKPSLEARSEAWVREEFYGKSWYADF